MLSFFFLLTFRKSHCPNPSNMNDIYSTGSVKDEIGKYTFHSRCSVTVVCFIIIIIIIACKTNKYRNGPLIPDNYVHSGWVTSGRKIMWPED